MTQIPTETRSTRFAKAKKTAQTLKVPPLKSLFLSANSKTGFSINTAIPLTCRPTAACAQYCYGLEGRSIMLPAFRRQIGNAQRFAALESAPDLNLIYEAIGVAEQVLPKQNFLRFFGVGDLQPGSVRFINTLSMTVPELTLWVATRRFDLAERLAPRANVHVMLGLDTTTRPVDVKDVRQIVQQRPRYFASWVQREAKEHVPPWVSVIFAEHHLRHRATWSRQRADARVCRATIDGGAAHDGACAHCQRCFNERKR